MTGKLIIITSPSGGGKGTLIKNVRALMPDLGFSVSHTTRSQRQGEEHAREYFFVDRAEFERKIAAGEFLEHAEVHGNLYGTSLSESMKVASSGKDLIVEIDVQGALQIMKRSPGEVVSIFIMPPSFEVLEERLTARGTESHEQLTVRLRNAFSEIRQYTEFEYIVVNNEIYEASRDIASIIVAERRRQVRQTAQLQDILNSFDASMHRY